MSLPVVTVDRLAFGGSGVCRIDGKVCFVPYSCPGDTVTLRITAEKKSYCTAAIAEILTPSPFRTAPLCPLFGRCGGCSWQHVGYPLQLESKRGILADALRKGARIPAGLVEDAVAAPAWYGYRRRTQFNVSYRDEKLRIGFYRPGSHNVEDAADGCPVAAPVINQVLARFRTLLEAYPDAASVSRLAIDAGDRGVIVVIHQSGPVSPESRVFLSERSDDFGACTGLYLKTDKRPHPEKLWGSAGISYCMQVGQPDRKPMELSYPPGGFAQVNQAQNAAMLDVIRRLGRFTHADRLLDLYCGNGNLSLPLSAVTASVVGVEGSADSIAAANYNKMFNRVANIRFICDDVTSGIRSLAEQGAVFDAVLLDPPRAGAGDAVPGIVAFRPDRIVYVSCDPGTLARDCGQLQDLGYAVAASVPLDMFPQSYHLESVTLLCRS